MIWGQEEEKQFFIKLLAITSYQNLFYKIGDEFLAYYPKKSTLKSDTLQSRNSLIGSYTEKYVSDLVQECINRSHRKLFAVQNAICEELSLPSNSNADVAICTTPDKIQKPENIKLVMEVKMSIINNWAFDPFTGLINFYGDIDSHKGNPSLLRSDSVLKAIGKSLNIRISHESARKIPIIVIGNTPISRNYINKSLKLTRMGFIQGFWCIGSEFSNKNPTGYIQINDLNSMTELLNDMLNFDFEFVATMKTKSYIGKLIEIANQEQGFENKAEKFIKMLNKQ